MIFEIMGGFLGEFSSSKFFFRDFIIRCKYMRKLKKYKESIDTLDEVYIFLKDSIFINMNNDSDNIVTCICKKYDGYDFLLLYNNKTGGISVKVNRKTSYDTISTSFTLNQYDNKSLSNTSIMELYHICDTLFTEYYKIIKLIKSNKKARKGK